MLAAIAVVAMLVGFVQPAFAAPGWPVLSAGSSGPDVGTAQHLLRHHGHGITADGAFGPRTRAAVVAFQQARGFTADGIVGAQTWGGLIVTVRQGDTGEAVAAVQTALGKHGAGLAVDGAFGPATAAAVRSFQSANGLAVDGIAGPQTWQHLLGGGGGGGGFSLPIPRGALSRGYYTAPHHDYPALDLPVGSGTPLYAVRSGVANRISNSRCGLGYSLAGDDGASYLYCHLSSHGVGSGTRVGAGAQLGWSGSTGNSTGPHLHLEIHAGGVNRCPQPFLLAIHDGRTPPAAAALPTGGCVG
ncbi:hypothetical protein JCM33774_71620 [Actinophytocola sp. KF-1]